LFFVFLLVDVVLVVGLFLLDVSFPRSRRVFLAILGEKAAKLATYFSSIADPVPAPGIAPIASDTAASAPRTAPIASDTAANAPGIAPIASDAAASAPRIAPIASDTAAGTPGIAPIAATLAPESVPNSGADWK